ncbi:MAG: MBL fold metallo-hydrolase [Pseudomonadota bacterium]
MRIEFFGVRGSIPSPGPQTVYYGGNTSCVLVETDAGDLLIFDAGTGIRLLGQRLRKDKRTIHLLLSHQHWDHIQGLPFFTPIYQHDCKLHVYASSPKGMDVIALTQMSDPAFPVDANSLGSHIKIHNSHCRTYNIGTAKVLCKPLNHPGGGAAYIIEADGYRFGYATDNELFPPEAPATSYEDWVKYFDGLDALVHDATYVEEELEETRGWGHSTVNQAVQLAIDARVKHLLLFHHDPDRSDEQLREIHDQACKYVVEKGGNTKVSVAREGLVLDLSDSG